MCTSHTYFPDMPLWSVFQVGVLRVCASARQPVKKCACVCAHVLHTNRAPQPPSPLPFPQTHSRLCLPSGGSARLMAGVPPGKQHSPAHLCPIRAPGSRLRLNGSPGSQRTTFLIAHDACGCSTNTTVATGWARWSRGCCACVNLVFLGAERPERGYSHRKAVIMAWHKPTVNFWRP